MRCKFLENMYFANLSFTKPDVTVNYTETPTHYPKVDRILQYFISLQFPETVELNAL
jgi:hypothetical protein